MTPLEPDETTRAGLSSLSSRLRIHPASDLHWYDEDGCSPSPDASAASPDLTLADRIAGARDMLTSVTPFDRSASAIAVPFFRIAVHFERKATSRPSKGRRREMRRGLRRMLKRPSHATIIHSAEYLHQAPASHMRLFRIVSDGWLASSATRKFNLPYQRCSGSK